MKNQLDIPVFSFSAQSLQHLALLNDSSLCPRLRTTEVKAYF
jgi:hypothetical protein